MYSNIKSVQILISLLKKYEIKNLVLSPGGSDVPIIHSVETDKFFKCYSVVDERNAAYYALGLSQKLNEPVACICTSGSAICNYLPGITEAFYQDARVVAITADKNPYFQGQLETQKIDQMNTFSNVVKKSVNLPIIANDNDEWLCNRLINEALLELDHHGKGPVHINIPIIGNTTVFDVSQLPDERKINVYELENLESNWKAIAELLNKKEKIMVVVGQNIKFEREDIKTMDEFFKKYNCFYATEHLSNLKCDGAINTYPITENSGLNDELLPDLVISIGNNLAAYGLKPYLRNNYKKFENWYVTEKGEVRDAYKCLTNIFECSISYFFKKMVEYSEKSYRNDMNYYNKWIAKKELLEDYDFNFSNFYVAKKLSSIIPSNSTLHLAILNSTRIMQFFELKDNVETFSNVGTLGIDGCLATFMGQAAAKDNLSYLVIGDLSFFYGMNAAAMRSLANNVRIILLNNFGGSEFQFYIGKETIDTIDKHICAEHKTTAEGFIKSLGYSYYSATSKEELDEVIDKFGKPSNTPLFLEVFTDMHEDARLTNEFYKVNKIKFSKDEGGISGLKKLLVSKMSVSQKNKIKKIFKK